MVAIAKVRRDLPALVGYTEDALFGDVWNRTEPSAKERSPLLTIRPGDVIRIAGGEEHWRGATEDCFMTHIAIDADTE